MTHKIENHECFDTLVEETGSDATFVRSTGFDLANGKASVQWGINLFTYTPSLGISTRKGFLIPTFCPMCGEDFRDDQSHNQEK